MSDDDFEFTFGKYPAWPGHRGVSTSIEAASDLAPRLGRLQAMVLGAIEAAGAHGLTADECCDALDLDRWTVQPRTSELKAKGQIVASEQRRPNKTGKRAIVWISRKHAQAEALAA